MKEEMKNEKWAKNERKIDKCKLCQLKSKKKCCVKSWKSTNIKRQIR